MCGRTACALDKDTICQRCTMKSSSNNRTVKPQWQNGHKSHQYVPSHNIAPGSFTPVLSLGKILNSSDEVVVQPMRWGLVPSFARGNDSDVTGFKTSNARLKSLLDKPTYGTSMRQGKRCIVLAQGFYEWKSKDGRKQPYYIHPSDPKKMLMMAGVFAFNEPQQLYSYSVITTESAGQVANVHHRMPVILTSDDEAYAWLDSGHVNMNQAYTLLERIANSLGTAPLDLYPVTPRMNSTAFDDPSCTQPMLEYEDIKKPTKVLGSPNIMSAFLKRAKSPVKKEEEALKAKSPKRFNTETATQAATIKRDPFDEIKF